MLHSIRPMIHHAYKQAHSQEEIVRDHAYVDKAKLSPARIFKSPMDVVKTNDIGPAEKLAILQACVASGEQREATTRIRTPGP